MHSSPLPVVYEFGCMARLRRLVPGGRIFFVTTNLQRGLPLFTPAERDLLCDCLATIQKQRQFQLAGFVAMPDHLHLLVLPAAEDTISALVQELKYLTSRKVNAARHCSGTLWQKGFFDRFMRTGKEFSETLDYMHQNPIRKGLARRPGGWRWSSASAYAARECIIPVDFLRLPAQPEKRLG